MAQAISSDRLFEFVREWIAAATTTELARTEPKFNGLEQMWAPTLRIPRSQWLPVSLRENTELCERLQTLVEARGCLFHKDLEGTIYIYVPA